MIAEIKIERKKKFKKTYTKTGSTHVFNHTQTTIVVAAKAAELLPFYKVYDLFNNNVVSTAKQPVATTTITTKRWQ